jgi:alginate export protein
MKKIFIVISLLCLVFADAYQAQDNVKISAQIRPRFQFDNKDFTDVTSGQSFTELRSRLGVQFTPLKTLTIFAQLQDSRIFGTEPSTLANTSNVDLHQAYFLLKQLFNLPIHLKAGRMEVVYGPQRLMGAVGWSNVGRSFDGIIVTVKTEKVEFDLFALKETETFNDGDSLDLQVLGLYSNLNIAKDYKIQPFFIAQVMFPINALSRYTTGIYISGSHGGFFHEAEFAFQFGKITPDSLQKDISAMMGALNIGYKINAKVKPTISAGVDYLSGDDGSDRSKTKVFNTLYGTNHKYYGFMDYFINIPANTLGLGLMDIHGKFSFMPASILTLKFAYHMFMSAEDFTLVDGSTTKEFGSELDVTAILDYNEYVKFETGFSFFSPGDIFKRTRGENTAMWFYLMAVVSI